MAALDNDEGFVLILAMSMMLLLSMLGSFAVTNTSTEIKISGNERATLDVFYISESGWMQGFQWIENWGSSSAPPLIKGVNADPQEPMVAQIINKSLGNDTYSYDIRRSSAPVKVPGNNKAYLKFLYKITSNATGPGNAARSVEVGVEKISK